jgi:RNA-directed DNA polymerase
MKGRASHIGPESCASLREGWCEALTGVLVGQVLSRESPLVRDADAVCGVEGNTVGMRYRQFPADPARSETLARRRNLLFGNREISCLTVRDGRSAPGRPEGRSQ